MAVKLGNGNWAVKEDKLLAYNDNSGRFFNKEFDFARGSSATYVGKDGLIKSAASDVPRIDFSDSTNGALLLEPIRTNLVTQSNNTTTNVWGHYNYGGGLIVDTYGYDSPDGKNEASRLVYTNSSAGSGGALLTTNITLLATGIYTISLWAKSVSGTKEIRFSPKSTSSSGTSGSRITLTNEWKRYTHTFTNDGGTSRGFQFRISESEDSGDRTFDVWGMTIEEGSYATSTIPTQGSAVTRLADVCNNSGSAQDFNSEEGVLYAEIAALANDGTFRFISLKNNTTVDIIRIGYITTSNRIEIQNYKSGVLFNSFNYEVQDVKTNSKIAFKWKDNDFQLYINGLNVLSNTSVTAWGSGVFQSLQFDQHNGGNAFYGNTRDLRIYNTALTDQELIALTTI